ncbi:MAG TPA: tRNA lysidine(34) synthetase TilS [Alphaproteobacteria bacterium]
MAANFPVWLNADKCPEKIAIAVSGGADSIALLHVLAEKQQANQQQIVALTVDHGLRADSAHEAQMVAQFCAGKNIEHHILNWNDAKPQTGLQSKAAKARRTLLIAKCRELGITDLYLAHQADDQAETLLQRLARGAGVQGLRGMQEMILQDGVTIRRPLLQVRRADLRRYCEMHQLPFVDDPSNENTKFERIRWRKTLGQMEGVYSGFVTGLLRSQKRFDATAQAMAQLAQRWIAQHRIAHNDQIILPHALLAQEPQALIVEILRQLMVTEKRYKADLERLEDWVAQAFSAAPQETALTLDGWWLRLTTDKLTLQTAPARRFKAGT